MFKSVRHGSPSPTKTEHRYWFSISRCLLPAVAGNHARAKAGLISNTGLSQSGQVDGGTTVVVGLFWRKISQFSQAKTKWKTGLLAQSSGAKETIYEERNKEEKRPDKGARLSRR